MLPCGTFNTQYRQDMAICRTKTHWLWLGLLIVAGLTAPLYLRSDLLNIVNIMGITIVAVMGLNILTGYCGQISVGQAAFVALGGSMSAALTLNCGFPFWAALPCAALTAGVVGLIFGLPSARVKGFYLAVATLAAHIIIMWAILHIDFFGAAGGISAKAPKIGGLVFNTHKSFYYLIIASVALAAFFTKNVGRTRVGRAFIAIRDNDLAAETLGINVVRYKLLAFFFCCAFGGWAGSLYAHYIAFADPDAFTLFDSIWYLGMLVVGGMGSTAGVFMGVIFMRALEFGATTYLAAALGEAFPAMAGVFAGFAMLVYGLVILLFLIFEPRGLAHRWEIFKNSYRLNPFAY